MEGAESLLVHYKKAHEIGLEKSGPDSPFKKMVQKNIEAVKQVQKAEK